LGLILAIKPFLCLAATPEGDENRFQVLWAGGPVTAYHDERDETAPLRIFDWVDDGDNISTGAKSQALLRLPNKAYIYLGSHTKIHISRLRSGDKGLQIRLNLLTGTLWCQLDEAPRGMTFEASMRSLVCRCHGTLFEAVRQKNAVRINAYNGPVVTVSHGQVKIAKTGEITQYIDGKFAYKHRLQSSDDDRLDWWKAHLADILAKTPVH